MSDATVPVLALRLADRPAALGKLPAVDGMAEASFLFSGTAIRPEAPGFAGTHLLAAEI